MPSFAQYKNLLGSHTNGDVRKNDSWMIEEALFDEDVNSETVYFYDYYHDDYKTQLNDLDPENDKKKIPVRIKYIKGPNQTYEKDQTTHRIQFKPSYRCNIPYYKEMFEDMYDARFPVGLLLDRKDTNGNYNKWLVVAEANADDNMYPTYEILRCNHVIQVVMKNKLYNFSAVLRSQNSYNSGIWTDFRVTSVEDQQKFCVPVNRDTEMIYYNQRIVIDNKVVNREPRTWEVTKVNLVTNKGVIIVTLAQTMFDAHKDYIEKDENGNVIGMWADFYESNIEPERPSIEPPLQVHSSITYSGTKPEIKSGGSYKKFTVRFFKDDDEIEFQEGSWSYSIDGEDASGLLTVLDNTLSSDVNENQIKIKFNKDDSYIGKVLVVSYTTIFGTKSSVEIQILGL